MFKMSACNILGTYGWSPSWSSRWASQARRHRSRPHQDLDHHSTFPVHEGARNAHASNIARMEYVFCPRSNKISIIVLALATSCPHLNLQTAYKVVFLHMELLHFGRSIINWRQHKLQTCYRDRHHFLAPPNFNLPFAANWAHSRMF